jgi:cytochrome c oxidase subunit 2
VKGRTLHSDSPRRSQRAALGAAALAAVVAVLATGCSAQAQRGFLPGYDDGQVTNQTGRITNLWVGSWVAALAVGLITWGLILWCVTVYRKRKNDETLPVQLRYHVPLEIMYVILPIVMIGVLYYYTARDMTAIADVSTHKPDLTIGVVGKQWSWDFNYVDENVYSVGVQDQDVSAANGFAQLPTLYLPVGERVQFQLNSRDVIHSFWVPAFLYKLDVIPGRTNRFQIVPTRQGVYAGKCAELCGEYHSSMLFNVAVVTRAEYDTQMTKLRAKNQTGQLGVGFDRSRDARSSSSSQRGKN